MHIELTEMLRCPEPHGDSFLVMSTGEMRGRMIRSGVLGCPLCHREYPIVQGVVQFSRTPPPPAAPVPLPAIDAPTLQALLDLASPGGYVVLVGSAARHAPGLAGLMRGVHFVGVNASPDVEELPMLSLVSCATVIPLRPAIARGVVLGAEAVTGPWPAEAARVVLPGRRFVAEQEDVAGLSGITRLAAGRGVFVGERR
ncbi:MAG TPA: Trm112 family protein [Gemmatimonadales bacterium]|nr:Trm112 family protein [Gemmatimonadales bacterium]